MSMDDDDEGEQETTLVAETRKEAKKSGKKPSKKKTALPTTAVAGGWLVQATTTGSFIETNESEHEKEEGDDADTDEPIGSTTTLLPTRRRSSLGGGMPAWGRSTSKPTSADTTTDRSAIEPKAAPSRGLGGGRPPWAPAPPPVAAPDPEPAAKEDVAESIAEAGDDSSLPDWLAAAATGATKTQVIAGYGVRLKKLAGVIALERPFVALYGLVIVNVCVRRVMKRIVLSSTESFRGIFRLLVGGFYLFFSSACPRLIAADELHSTQLYPMLSNRF